jgi:hypothetical protein
MRAAFLLSACALCAAVYLPGSQPKEYLSNELVRARPALRSSLKRPCPFSLRPCPLTLKRAPAPPAAPAPLLPRSPCL